MDQKLRSYYFFKHIREEWKLGDGTVFVKDFWVESRLFETWSDDSSRN